MLELRFRRRCSLRSLLLIAVGLSFSLFPFFSWYTFSCCRIGLYEEYGVKDYNPKKGMEHVGMDNYKHSEIIGIHHSGKRKNVGNAELRSIVTQNVSKRLARLKKHKHATILKNVQPTALAPYHTSTKADPYYLLLAKDRESRMSTISTTTPQSLPPTLQVDQYVVRAWLPRGIKERSESNSYEVLQGVTEAGIPAMEFYPVSFTTPIPGYGVVKHPKKRSVMISPPIKRLPQALIIGVKKCGTRALLEFLRVHPDIRASGPETHFFDRHYQRGLEWYRQQMPTSLEGQITMEKTPSYFITKEVPPRIHSMSPSVRLLVVVRDPVTRAISDYTQSTSKRKDTPSFEDMAFLNVTTGLVDTSWSAIRIGVYARFLEWWTRYFNLDRMLFISGENLIKDPAGEMGRVQDFLGLKQVISDKHFYFNETKGFPCLKKSEGSGNPHCLGKTKGRAHPDISLATIQRLRDFYRPFNMKFYQMVGRNFGWP